MSVTTWTAEQQAILAAAERGEPGKVLAYAGTGKTTTLTGVADRLTGKRVLYLAFNRVTAEEARRTFPAHVEAKTAHSLAFAATRPWRGYRPLVGSWWKLRAQIVSTFPRYMRGDDRQPTAFYGRTESQIFQAVAATLGRYCASADGEPQPRHVPQDSIDPILAQAVVQGLPESACEHLAAQVRHEVAAVARKVWDALCTRADWPLTHDVYLKYWQLQHPALPYDVVLFDEAQDANPVMQDLVLHGGALTWMVGDSYQAIYGWRGAIDALDQYAAPAYPLSQSWRFGPAIAGVGRRILDTCWQVAPPLTGMGGPGQVIAPPTVPDLAASDDGFDLPDHAQQAIVCRGNLGVFQAALNQVDFGKAVAVAGGIEPICDLIEGAVALFRGGRTNQPDLRDFPDWQTLAEYADTTLGQAYRPIVRLVQTNPDAAARHAHLLRTQVVSEDVAGIVISTGHKAKGRQWPVVSLADDWRPFAGVADDGHPWLLEEEARLFYVAVTRARQVLDLSATGPIWQGLDDWHLAQAQRVDRVYHIRAIQAQ